MNPIRTLQHAVNLHNKYPSRSRIINRDRIRLVSRGWGGYWVLFAKPYPMESTGPNTARRVPIAPDGTLGVYCAGYVEKPFYSIDLKQQTFYVRTDPRWGMCMWHARVLWAGGIWPGCSYPHYTYADRYNRGGVFINLGDHGSWESPGLTIRYDGGNIVDVRGKRVHWFTPDASTRRLHRQLRRKLLDVLLPYEMLRRSAPDDVVESYFPESLVDYVNQHHNNYNLVELLDGEYSKELHLFALCGGQHMHAYYSRMRNASTFDRGVRAVVRRYLARQYGQPL